MSGAVVRAVGVRTGWGPGVAALPANARRAAGGRTIVAIDAATPRAGDRLRRATRECLLAVDAVEAALADGGLGREAIAGADTALVYVTAAAYGPSNRAFVEGGGGALHFPYTAPSAVPAEVAIEFGLHGPYAVLIGGAATTIEALAHAAALLARGACARALVLAVETFVECAAVLTRGGLVGDEPLVEAAAAALLEPAKPGEVAHRVPSADDVSERAGQTWACAPLIALAVARAQGGGAVALHGRWRGREATTTVGVAS